MSFFLSIENIDEELAWLDPAERWELFLAPLIRALAEEHLGEVIDVESLVSNSDGRRVVIADEISIEVSDTEGAAELALRIEQQAKLAKGVQ